jgi:hypothetical protein
MGFEVEDVDDDDGGERLVSVIDREDEASANDDARLLVEHGVGAHVVPIPAAELPDDGPRAGYRVEVLPVDLERAQGVLGLAEVEPPFDPRSDWVAPEQGKTPWKTFAVIWIVAMLVVPALAFLLTYNLMSR